MVIDELGDGEFVEKLKNKELKVRKCWEVVELWDESFDGFKKMVLRVVLVEMILKCNVILVLLGDIEDDLSMLNDVLGEDIMFEVKWS